LAKVNLETEFCILDLEPLDFGAVFLEAMARSQFCAEAKEELKQRVKSLKLNFLQDFKPDSRRVFLCSEKLKFSIPKSLQNHKLLPKLSNNVLLNLFIER